MQKVYFRFIAWLVPMSWLLAFWIMVAGIWATAEKTSSFKALLDSLKAWNVGYTNFAAKFVGGFFLYLVGPGLIEFGAWWMREKVVSFYRWNEQDWWNYDASEAPKNFPAQLGEFVDY